MDLSRYAKARIVARGFRDSDEVDREVPTCFRESIIILLFMAVCNNWDIYNDDVKTAYLQGEDMQRKIFITPPREMNLPNTAWLLNKALYGLRDAGRHWWTKLAKSLHKMGLSQSSIDPCVFSKHEGKKLVGLVVIHVDDIIYTGTPKFCKDMHANLKKTFIMSHSEKNHFIYNGIEIKSSKEKGTAEINQQTYVTENMNIPLRSSADTDESERRKELQEILGKLLWVTRNTQPTALHSTVILSQKVKEPTMNFLEQAAITAQYCFRHASEAIKISKIDLSQDIIVKVFCDASPSTTPQSSHLGYVACVGTMQDETIAVPLVWISRKSKRKSTVALHAEVFAAQEAHDHGIQLAKFLTSIVGKFVQLNIITDSKSLFDNIKSAKAMTKKRVNMDLAVLRESFERKEFILTWTDKNCQLADPMTKSYKQTKLTRQVLQTLFRENKLPRLVKAESIGSSLPTRIWQTEPG